MSLRCRPWCPVSIKPGNPPNSETVHNFTSSLKYKEIFAREVTQNRLKNRFATEKVSLAILVVELSCCAAISVPQGLTVFFLIPGAWTLRMLLTGKQLNTGASASKVYVHPYIFNKPPSSPGTFCMVKLKSNCSYENQGPPRALC